MDTKKSQSVWNLEAKLVELVKSLATKGFRQFGRGAIWLNLEKEGSVLYMTGDKWEAVFEKNSIHLPSLKLAIDSYNPNSQAVLVIASPFEEKPEIASALMNF